jgi:hypothetical protein
MNSVPIRLDSGCKWKEKNRSFLKVDNIAEAHSAEEIAFSRAVDTTRRARS